MNNREFAEIVQRDLRPIVAFTKAIEDCEGYAEKGMRGRIIGAKVKHDGLVSLTVDFTGLDDFNKPFESANYYDKTGKPCLTARAVGRYQPREEYTVMSDEETPFEVVEPEAIHLYEQYMAEKGEGEHYVTWLEKIVLAHAVPDMESSTHRPVGG